MESAKGLNRHYELTTTDDLQMNFKQFLKHIGERERISVYLVLMLTSDNDIGTGIDIAVSEAGG